MPCLNDQTKRSLANNSLSVSTLSHKNCESLGPKHIERGVRLSPAGTNSLPDVTINIYQWSHTVENIMPLLSFPHKQHVSCHVFHKFSNFSPHKTDT